MKVPEGAFRSKNTQIGTAYFHKLKDDNPNPSQPARAATTTSDFTKGSVWATPEEAQAAIAVQVKGVFVQAWAYHDANGFEVMLICRFHVNNGDKTIRPIHQNGDGSWVQGDPRMEKLPLYALPSLNEQKRVFVTEGEKPCDMARSLGLVATTSSHGAKAASKTDWSPLAGKEIIILPDNDDDGQIYVQNVVRELANVDRTATLRIVELPDLPHKGDIVEFVEAREDTEPERLGGMIKAMADAAKPLDLSEYVGGLIVRTASNIQQRPVEWLWRYKLVAGAINLLVGMPNQGKSVLTLDIAARVTTGTPWPVGEHRDNPAGSVAVLAIEDSPETTIVPRLRYAGADLEKIYIVEGVKRIAESEDDTELTLSREGFDISRDVYHLDLLRQQVPDLKLVIIDPLDSYIGRVDSKSGNEVRNALWPLKDWCELHGITMVIAHHFNKNISTVAIDRVSGSRSFGALPRAVWAVGKDAQDPNQRTLVLPIKLNLVKDPAGMAFELRPSLDNPEIPVVAWIDEEVKSAAGELLGSEPSAKNEAVEFLANVLADGPQSVKKLKSQSSSAGIAWRTILRAKEVVGITSTRKTDDKNQVVGWEWCLKRA